MSWVLIKTKEICVGIVGNNEKLERIVLGRDEKDLKEYAEENKKSESLTEFDAILVHHPCLLHHCCPGETFRSGFKSGHRSGIPRCSRSF